MAVTDIKKSNAPLTHPPRDVFSAMRNEMDAVLERFVHGWPGWPVLRTVGAETMLPDLDVHDDGKQLVIEADLPGLDEKDVSVSLANGLLRIKGERKSEREQKEKNYFVTERSYGNFQRVLQLPDTVDEGTLEAMFDKGVLKIVAQHKPEAARIEKRIEIKKA